METQTPEFVAEQMKSAPTLDKFLSEPQLLRGAAVQASLTLLTVYGKGEVFVSDVLEIARYINIGEVS